MNCKIVLTLEDLKSKGACENGLDLFTKWFGNKAEIEWSPMHELLCRCDSNIKDFTVWLIDMGLLPSFNFASSKLYGSYLRKAILTRLDLRYSDLRWSNLQVADLSNANLFCADLRMADLYGANLYNANLYGTNLRGANLSGCRLPDNYKDVCIL